MGRVETDLVRGYYAAWSRGDLEGMLARADPDIDMQPTLGVLYDHSSYHGHAGVRAWFDEVAGRWQEFDPAVEEIHEDDGRVIAFICLSATRNERKTAARIAVEHELRDGRIATLIGHDYWEVREELGLPV